MLPNFKQFFSDLVPPGTRIRIELELPSDSGPTRSSDAASLRPDTMPASVPKVLDISSARSAANGPNRPRGSSTALQRVDEIRRERGDVWLKRDEWSRVIEISVRELERAQRYGPLQGSRKGTGLDSNATVLCASDVHAYVALVDSVLRGEMAPPDWWPMVRLGRAA